MKKKINIAVVAYGKIAKTHILATYMSNLKIDIPFELKVTHIITKRKTKIPFSNICVCSSLEEALENENDIDIVDICNINEAHYEDVKTAIKYNKAIYCEKPLTDNIIKSKEITELVKDTNLLNAVPLVFRYLPCLHLLKKELETKSLGEVISFEGRYYHCGYLDDKKRNSWRTKYSSGGGASLDLGIHLMDCVRFLFGNPKHVENVYSSYFNDVETDEIYRAKIIIDDKLKGEISTSRIFSQNKQSIFIEVFCVKGSYICEFDNPFSLKKIEFNGNVIDLKPSLDASYMKYMNKESEATSFHLDAHMCCMVDFARKVFGTTSGSYYATFEEAYISQRLVTSGKNLER